MLCDSELCDGELCDGELCDGDDSGVALITFGGYHYSTRCCDDLVIKVCNVYSPRIVCTSTYCQLSTMNQQYCLAVIIDTCMHVNTN